MLYLASRSPRRRELLVRLGLAFEVIDLDIPEQRQPGEAAEAYVRRVAREKAAAGWSKAAVSPGSLVLGADTEVILDDEVLGKPNDDEHAASMLRRLSGRTHRVLSAVTVMAGKVRSEQAVSVSEVTFAAINDVQIAAYVASGECHGKAGGYAIQGGAERFVRHLSGSYSGVVGLPLYETAALLRQFGALA
ncbi:MAG: Maf family nucleotide pyrophosphatase [Pseudomonadota bacterium]|nr:Maf family nucleotide pyrophosphatase [Pseudomonadota bacterium]